jgi:hypothetical protein
VLRNEPHLGVAKGLAFYQLASATADWVMWIWLAGEGIFSGGTAIVVVAIDPLPAGAAAHPGDPRRLDHGLARPTGGERARGGDLIDAAASFPALRPPRQLNHRISRPGGLLDGVLFRPLN